ncbi:MAG: hypothetical protein M1575_01040 [Patescibacteria group bacterium]|nr:hypothetical protein [Patescibacteria group bacterium]MCL5095305.1 hypothetical protein [Patescibacteria group bacterium]
MNIRHETETGQSGQRRKPVLPGFPLSPRKPGTGEALPSRQSLRENNVILRIYMPAYGQIAQRLTEEGLGKYSVRETREQITPYGQPLTNPLLVVVRFRGQKDWGPFWQVAYPTKRAIDEAYRQGKGQSEINKIVEERIQVGIKSVATLQQTRKSI